MNAIPSKIPKNKLDITAYILIIFALAFGFFSRLVSAFTYVTFFYFDQARDAEIYMKMWQGIVPSLGAGASVGGYQLFPLYYYLVFPSTILGVDPVFQVLPNAILSFLSIPLFIFLIYQLLERIERSKRLFLAGLAGLWYSSLFVEIFINTYQWNPGPIPFFTFCFILLFQWQSEKTHSWSFLAQAGLWLLYGIVVSILASLHSTTLFVIPVVFVASIIFFLFKNIRNKSKYWLPLLSIISAIIVLIPYGYGEFHRGWSNTKSILHKVTNAGTEASSRSIIERIGKAFYTFIELGQQSYFFGFSRWQTLISISFFSLLLILGIFTYKRYQGNLTITLLLSFICLIYIYAASNFWGLSVVHYKFIILWIPIVLTVVALATLDFAYLSHRIAGVLLFIFIFISVTFNFNSNAQFFLAKYGAERVISTADVVNILEKIPVGSTLCDIKAQEGWSLFNIFFSYKYLDKYMSKRNLSFVKDCQRGHYVIQPKNEINQDIEVSWPMFTLSKNNQLKGHYQLFLETSVAYIYRYE